MASTTLLATARLAGLMAPTTLLATARLAGLMASATLVFRVLSSACLLIF
jgi:hypothetical protein